MFFAFFPATVTFIIGNESHLKIDIFTHILPGKYRQALYKKAQGQLNISAYGSLESHHNNIPALFDVGRRFDILDEFEGIRQVLTVPVPPIEALTSPADATELSRLANDEMAELVARYPDRFVAAVACLPMNSVDAALKETERAIDELSFKGIQLFTSINGKPLDSPEFMTLFETMTRYDLPIWIHPVRGRDTPDYKGESYSKFRIFHIFGWPFETSAALTRLVFSGVFERLPNVKFITHHCGGMISFFAERLATQGQAMVDKQGQFTETTANLSRPVEEYFKMFYADTAIEGNTAGLMCGHAFFGADRIVFGTDQPYGGVKKLGRGINAVEEMAVSDADKRKIFEDNARRLLHL